MERACNARARKAREWFERTDSLPALERRLLSYFGTKRGGEGLAKRNPEDVAAYLGDRAGFEAYCAEVEAVLPDPVADDVPVWKGWG